MGDEEVEYEVESITKARLEKLKGKKKGLSWKYQVRWKGYGPGDDTWEPPENFVGSEHFIDYFWARANTNGRDFKDTSLFQAGDEFFPTGPPRRKGKRKSLNPGASSSRTASAVASPIVMRDRSPTPVEPLGEQRKRTASTQEHSEDRPIKRPREDLTSTPVHTPPEQTTLPGRPNRQRSHVAKANSSRSAQRKITRSPSFGEIIPASEEEDEVTKPAPFKSPFPRTITTGDNGNAVGSTEREENSLDTSSNPQPPTVSSHRTRATNPQVKMVEDPNVDDMDGAIAVKARLTGRSANSLKAAAPSRKPGPGRSSSGFSKKNTSSLLTFEKGALKTIKGRYHKPASEGNQDMSVPHDSGSTPASLFGDFDDNSETLGLADSTASAMPPPTAEELLQLAGAEDFNSNSLPDFEDDDPTPVTEALLPQLQPQSELGSPTSPPEAEPKSALEQSLELAKDRLFPSGATAAVVGGLSAILTKPTIFGPLGLGSKQPNTAPDADSLILTKALPFSLNIDPSTCVPVFFADISANELPLPISAENKGLPGKFYGQGSVSALIDTLRTVGPSSKVLLNPDSTDEQKEHFELFRARSNAGELFIAMAGAEMLAFCSSTQALTCQRLNIPSMFTGCPGDLLVTRIKIQNYSDYAALAIAEA